METKLAPAFGVASPTQRSSGAASDAPSSRGLLSQPSDVRVHVSVLAGFPLRIRPLHILTDVGVRQAVPRDRCRRGLRRTAGVSRRRSRRAVLPADPTRSVSPIAVAAVAGCPIPP